MAGTGYGGGPWGGVPWGASGGGLQLLTALAVVENILRLTFNEPVNYTRILNPIDGSNIDRYVFAPDPTSLDKRDEATRPVSPAEIRQVDDNDLQIDVVTDRPFSSFPSRYTIQLNGLVSTTGAALDLAQSSILFPAVFKEVPAVVPDLAPQNRDFAKPDTRSALFDPLPNAAEADPLILGTFPTDGTGDYATDEGIVSYRKRVFRRLTTKKGAFAHTPNYGVTIPQSIKQLARQSTLQALAADAEEQIRREPETVSVSVTISAVDPRGFVVFAIRVKTNIGPNVDMEVPTNFSPIA